VSLVQSLTAAIVRSDGDALVLHVGEKPYVVSPGGNVEISPRELTLEAALPMLEELLPADSRSELEEFGAVQHDLVTPLAPSGERFTVVAARGGEDIWIELRRHRPADVVPEPAPAPPTPEPAPPPALPIPVAQAPAVAPPTTVAAAPPPAATKSAPPQETRPTLVKPSRQPEPVIDAVAPAAPLDDASHEDPLETSTSPAVVVPMRRSAGSERPHDRPARPEEGVGLERLLRLAASRNATTLYVVSNTRPSLRIDGEVRPLAGEPVFTTADVEALVIGMMPDGEEALRRGVEAEWVRDLPVVGRVRCTRFQDHRGPGAIFQLIGARAISADELGLSAGIRELANETDGLILITGPRASGKSTLFAALIDLINRNRSAHIITLESQIKYVHENRASIVSQREVRGDHDALLTMARTALREGPDILAIEDLRTREVVSFALEAAVAGHVIIGIVPAGDAAGAIERVLDLPADDQRRRGLQRALSESLRAVVAQLLLRKIGGGRVAARELLLNTHSVAALIAEGAIGQMAAALEHGRRAGMVSMNESLLDLVRSKVVDVREAYRHSPSRDALVKLLEREGLDTSFVERMA
jgi:twitching motility protein PilT